MLRQKYSRLLGQIQYLELRRLPVTLYGQLLQQRQVVLKIELKVARSRRRTVSLFRRRLRRDFGRRFSPDYQPSYRLQRQRLAFRRRRQ